MNDIADINTAESMDWTVPQWQREQPRSFWDPSRQLLKPIRDYQKIADTNNPILVLKKKFCVLRHRFWSVVTGADIPLSCQLGGGY